MTLPWYLWGGGAETIGLSHQLDRVRCSECHRWTGIPAFYPLGRVLCERCHIPQVRKAETWATTLAPDERSKP